MQELARYLIVAGIAITAIGCVVYLAARTGFRGLPGDISYQSEHVRVYFPIVTCLVLSAVMTLIAMIWRRFSGR